MSAVWVWIEHRNRAIKAISREALGAGREVAGQMGLPLVAIVAGSEVSSVATEAFSFGADSVLGSDDPSLVSFRVDAQGPLLAKLVGERSPAVVLIGGSSRGRDLAAWTAAALDAGLVPDATALKVNDGRVTVTRPVYAGKLVADVIVTEGIQFITLRNRAFAPAERQEGSGTPEWVEPAVSEDSIATQITGFEGSEGEVSLTDATIIISGGRGVGSEEGFQPVRELADVLSGAVGASRAAVDAGWIAYDYQVGQTGKTVSPDLYIAAGISGAIQHQAGMRTSKIVVAINKDADAPIFKLANYGLVGDLFQLLPALTAEFKSRLQD